jgi:Sec-independent protein translocase protein TatA
LWSIVVIALSVLVIFGLTTKWDEAQADLSGPV